MPRIRWIAAAAALALVAGPVEARRRQPEVVPNNPPVPRVRQHYIRKAVPRYRIHYVPKAVPRVRTHYLRKAVYPEVHTRWLAPPVQPVPIYRELAPPGSRVAREMKIVRNPHYQEGLAYLRVPERDRADVERHRLTRWANGGQAPRLKLERGEEPLLREAVKKQIYKEMGVSRFSPPGDINRANALIQGRYRRALRTGEALELLYPGK